MSLLSTSRSGRTHNTSNTRSIRRLWGVIHHAGSYTSLASESQSHTSSHRFTAPPQSQSQAHLTRSLLQLPPSRSHPKPNWYAHSMRSFLLEAHCKGAQKASSHHQSASFRVPALSGVSPRTRMFRTDVSHRLGVFGEVSQRITEPTNVASRAAV